MKAKLYSLTLLLAFFSFCEKTYGQAPTWQWAKSAGSDSTDFGYSVSTDAFGNAYVAGSFFGPTMTFGNITINNTTTTANVFIAKYDSTGNAIWAKSSIGTGYAEATCISSDANGNTYVAGSFFGPSITFGSFTLINTIYGDDIFIVKYDSAGNVIWVNGDSNSGASRATSIATDNFGNVYVTGAFHSQSIIFGTDTLFNSSIGNNSPDVFISKLDSSGNFLWTLHGGGDLGDEVQSITTDFAGNFYVTGFFYGDSLVFDASVFYNNSGGNSAEIFILKYDSSGNIIWSKHHGGQSGDHSFSVAVDLNGNTFIAGNYYSSTLSFGSFTLTNSCMFYNKVFAVKYDSLGNVMWAKNSNAGSCSEGATGITTDAFGNCYVTGFFTGPTITFGSISLLNPDGGSDLFVVKYNANGNVVWAKNIAGSYGAHASSITNSLSGNIYLCGHFDVFQIFFDSDTLVNSSTFTNSNDIFLAKLGNISTGIESVENNKSSLSIYPNPTSQQIILSFSPSVFSLLNLNVFNLLGEQVYEQTTFIEKQISIPVYQLPAGIYVMEVSYEGKKERLKFVKQ